MPGKTYYVYLRFYSVDTRFAPIPARVGARLNPRSPQILEGIKSYRVVTPTADDEAQFRQRWESGVVAREYERLSALFATKTIAQLNERTLRPEDHDGAGTNAQQKAEDEARTATRLLRLKSLLDRGVITDEEYQEKRKAIVKDL